MKIYHLSHTDLDGYGCQFVLDFYFKNCVFFNSNYGREINDSFTMILNEINKDLEKNANEKFIVFISDLNLTPPQCEELETALKDKNAKIFLLDHHQSGAESAAKYAWYLLDSSRCATKIVYEFLAKIYGANDELTRLVAIINAIDIWLKDDENFELGKVFLAMISSAKEINRVLFRQQNINYMFFLLKNACKFIGQKNANIGLEDNLHFLKKDFFKGEKEDTLGNLISNFIVKLLGENKERLSLFYEDYKGLLTYNIGNVSVIGNDFLVRNSDFDFFVDVNSRKSLSFRANDRIDVSLMAKKLVGGGGHKNASGGLFANFKDSSDYELIKAQMQDLITSKKDTQ